MDDGIENGNYYGGGSMSANTHGKLSFTTSGT